jgi:hypothetical protein
MAVASGQVSAQAHAWTTMKCLRDRRTDALVDGLDDDAVLDWLRDVEHRRDRGAREEYRAFRDVLS